jgi:hypothetical protein
VVFLPSSDGSTNTWKGLSRLCRVAPGAERMTPGSPTPVGANGCVTPLVQRRCPASYPTVVVLALVRSQCRPVPNVLQNALHDIVGVSLAQAFCRGSNLRTRSPAAWKIAVRLLVPVRAHNLAMIPTKTLSGSGSSRRTGSSQHTGSSQRTGSSRRTGSGACAASASGGAGALVD